MNNLGFMTQKDSQEKLLQFRMMEARLEGLMKHREFIANRILEIDATSVSIDEVAKSKGEVLFHVGGEAFMQAKPANEGRVVVIIGADVAMEKDVPDAKKILESRKKEAEDAMKHVQKEIETISKSLEAMLPELEAGHEH